MTGDHRLTNQPRPHGDGHDAGCRVITYDRRGFGQSSKVGP
jgi:pimeloyl-ACP methyl ester carboxylesterase